PVDRRHRRSGHPLPAGRRWPSAADAGTGDARAREGRGALRVPAARGLLQGAVSAHRPGPLAGRFLLRRFRGRPRALRRDCAGQRTPIRRYRRLEVTVMVWRDIADTEVESDRILSSPTLV